MNTAAIDPIYLWNFQRRLLQDAFAEADPSYWERRAEWFDTCNPAVALACRNKAAFIRMYGTESSAEVSTALTERYDEVADVAHVADVRLTPAEVA